MSHEIDTMMSVRARPWHISLTGDKTNVVADYPTGWDDAREKAGILWEPERRPLFTGPVTVPAAARSSLPKGTMIIGPEGADELQVMMPLPDWSRIARSDRPDSLESIESLSVQSSSYAIITNEEMGSLAEAYMAAWVKEGANVCYETVGSLFGGRVVWALIRLDEPIMIGGDHSATYPYILLSTSHDGSRACTAGPTAVRVVCWNTLQAADMGATNLTVTIRHTGSAQDRLEDARRSLANARLNLSKWAEVAEELCEINVTDTHLKMFLEEFAPIPEGATPAKETNALKAREVFTELYQGNNSLTGVPGNSYGLFMAVTEYLDHIRRANTPDTYLARVTKPEPIKRECLKKILEITATEDQKTKVRELIAA